MKGSRPGPAYAYRARKREQLAGFATWLGHFTT